MSYFLPPVAGDKFHHVPLRLSHFAKACMEGTAAFKAAFPDYMRYERKHAPNVAIVLPEHVQANAATGIPQDVRETAERHSRELAFNLSVFRSRVVRDRAHGSLDSSKLARLAAPGISARAFDRLAASAYKHREHSKATTTRPRVAIVADTCHDIRAKDRGYMRRVGVLAYTLGEAARLSGVDVALFHCRGTLWQNPGEDDIQKWREATGARKPLHIVTHVQEFGETIDPATFHVSQDHAAFVYVLRAATAHYQRNARGMGSRNGRGGVEYARLQGAQLVISIGTTDDGADIELSADASIEECVAAVVAHMAKRDAA